MPCDRIAIPGGTAIVCSRRRRYRCGFCDLGGGYQCDWKVSAGKTCDAYICRDHALEVAPGKHLCPVHQEAYAQWKKRREVQTP